MCTKKVDRVVEGQSPTMIVSGERVVQSTLGIVENNVGEKDDMVTSQQLHAKLDKNKEMEEGTRSKGVAFAESCLVEIPVRPLNDDKKRRSRLKHGGGVH